MTPAHRGPSVLIGSSVIAGACGGIAFARSGIAAARPASAPGLPGWVREELERWFTLRPPDPAGMQLPAMPLAGRLPTPSAPEESRDAAPSEAFASDPDADLLRDVFDEFPHGTAAYARLVQRHWGTVYASCQAILLQEQDAEEATQDAFLKAHRYLPSFRFESRFLTWLRRIAKNTALNRYRQRRTERDARERVRVDPSLQSGWIPWTRPQPTGRREALRRALEGLTPEDRMIVILHDIEGVPHQEIADALGLGHGAVRMRATRARAALRDRLRHLEPEGGPR